MPDQTKDIQFAIEIVLERGPVNLDDLMSELLSSYPELNGQQQWIGVAMSKLKRDGKIHYVGCEQDHYHGGSCRVERVTS